MNAAWFLRFLSSCLVFLALSGSAHTAYASPFTPEPGHGYAKVWLRWHWGFLEYADADGELVDIGDYHEVFVSTYGDLGLVDGLALFWHTDLVRVFTLEDPRDGDVESHVAPGDPALGLRFRFLQVQGFAMSVESSLRVPFASSAGQQEVFQRDAPNPRIGTLRIGAGVFEIDALLSVGHAFDGWYLAASLGYQWRSGGFADRLLWVGEGGVEFGAHWTVRARASGAHSLREGDEPPASSPSGIGNRVSWTGLALEVDYELSRGWLLGISTETGLGGVRSRSGGTILNVSLATVY
ncbi:MAG: hypothetical protein AAGF12_20420 [Myxococcota bacterium]